MILTSKPQQPNSHCMVEVQWDGLRGQMCPLNWDVRLCRRLCFNSSVSTIPRNQWLEGSVGVGEWHSQDPAFPTSCNAGMKAPRDRDLAYCLERVGTTLSLHRWVSFCTSSFFTLRLCPKPQKSGFAILILTIACNALPLTVISWKNVKIYFPWVLVAACVVILLGTFSMWIWWQSSLFITLPLSLVSSESSFRFTSLFSYSWVHFLGTCFMNISDSSHDHLN